MSGALKLPLQFVFLSFPVVARPNEEADELNLDYPNEEDDSAQKDSNNVDNSNIPPPFFRYANYTEEAMIGETISLPCKVENLLSEYNTWSRSGHFH